MNQIKNEVNKIKSNFPIFIIGCQRSGTSFLYRILSETLDIGFGRDNTLFLYLYESFYKYEEKNKKEKLNKLLFKIENSAIFKKRFNNLSLSNNEFMELLESYDYNEIVRTIYSYWAFKNGNKRWGGKTPDYTGNKQFLYDLFPDVKIIHLIRDGRDVHLSFKERKWGPKHPFVAAKYWKERVLRGSQDKDKYMENYIEIKYEELLEQPVKTFTKILDYLNIKENEREIAAQTFKNKIVPNIKPNNTYKWKSKMSKSEILYFEIEAAKILEDYGYEIVNKKLENYQITFFHKIVFCLTNYFLKLKSGNLLRYIKKPSFLRKY